MEYTYQKGLLLLFPTNNLQQEAPTRQSAAACSIRQGDPSTDCDSIGAAQQLQHLPGGGGVQQTQAGHIGPAKTTEIPHTPC